MNKKILIAAAAVAVLGAGGAAGFSLYWHRHDPLATAAALADKGDMKGAQLLLRRAVSDDPQNVEAHYRLGAANLALGDPIAAERELKAARDRGRQGTPLSLLLGRAYLAQGRYDDVLGEVSPDDVTDTDRAARLVLRARAQLGLRDIAAAAASAAEAERLDPKSATAAEVAAGIAAAGNERAAAEAAIGRALAINPALPDMLNLRAELKLADHEPAEALASLDAAITAAPANTRALLRRAQLRIDAGQDAAARADVDSVLSRDGGNVVALYFRMILRARAGQWADADADLQKLMPLIDHFQRGYYYAAAVKWHANQIEQAVDLITKYRQRLAADPDGLKLFAQIQTVAGRPQGAIDALRTAIQAGNTDPVLQSLLGFAQVAAGRPRQAIDAFETAATTAGPAGGPNGGPNGGSAGEPAGGAGPSPAALNAEVALVTTALGAGDIDRAAEAIARLKKQVGDTEITGNLDGLLKLAKTDLRGAREQFEGLLRAWPDSVQARINLGRVYALLGDVPAATRVLTEALGKQPSSEAALGIVIPMLLRDKQPDEAVRLLLAAHQAAPTTVTLTVALADAEVAAGTPDKALALLDEALRGDAGNVPLLVARARALARQDKGPETLEALRQALARAPRDFQLRRSLVDLLLAMKDTDAARDAVRDGLRAIPGDPELLQLALSVDLRTKGVDAALATADALRADPANMPAAATLEGDVLMAAKRYTDAAAAFSAENKAMPSEALAMREAVAWQSAGQPAKAEAALRDWLHGTPDSAGALLALATLDLRAGRLDQAAEGLRKVVEKRPNAAVALNNLAWIYQRRGDPRAMAIAQRAFLAGPSPQTADTLGWIQATQGQPANAVALLRQAHTQLKDDPGVAYHLAYALNATGDTDEAGTILRAIVTDPRTFDEKPDATKLLDSLTPSK